MGTTEALSYNRGVVLGFHWAALAFGLLVGSFLNVVIARLPAGESIVFPGSKCPKCQVAITWYQNIPVLSWLLLRGRCAACRAPISIRYPIIELLTGVLFMACAVRFGPSWASLFAFVFAGGLVVITFVDIDIWEIPDEVSLPGILIGCAFRPLVFDVPWWSGLAGAALGAGALWLVRLTYEVLRGQEGMGLGDVKLIGMIGAFVGPGGLLPTIIVASFSGTIIGVVLLVAGGGNEVAAEAEALAEAEAGTEPGDEPGDEPGEADEAAAGEDDEEDWTPPAHAVPFGPFLALGALTHLLLEPAINRWLYA